MGSSHFALFALLACSGGKNDSALDLGEAPTVSISSPESGSSWTEGEPILFSADVADAEADASAIALSWSSDVDGEISTIPADDNGVAEFTYAALSAGDHLLTLSATDGYGLRSEDSVSFTVAP